MTLQDRTERQSSKKTTTEVRAHPIPAHDALAESPLRPHLPHHDAQSLVRRIPVLALHPHLEHLHGARKNRIRGTRHRARRGSLPQRELSKRRDDAFRDAVRGEEQRIDTGDPQEGARHP